MIRRSRSKYDSYSKEELVAEMRKLLEDMDHMVDESLRNMKEKEDGRERETRDPRDAGGTGPQAG
jgi:hypothetical protein